MELTDYASHPYGDRWVTRSFGDVLPVQLVQPVQPLRLLQPIMYIATSRAGNLAQKMQGMWMLWSRKTRGARPPVPAAAELRRSTWWWRWRPPPSHQPAGEDGRRPPAQLAEGEEEGWNWVPAACCRFHAIPNIDKCPHQLSTPLLGNCEKLFVRGASQQIWERVKDLQWAWDKAIL